MQSGKPFELPKILFLLYTAFSDELPISTGIAGLEPIYGTSKLVTSSSGSFIPGRHRINILPHNKLPLLLRRSMFEPRLLTMRDLELPDKHRIPQFTRNPQILTTPHQRVGFTALSRRWYAFGIEILLFAPRYRY